MLTTNLIAEILRIKKFQSIFHIGIAAGSIIIVVFLEKYTGCESPWWYFGAVVISAIIIMTHISLSTRWILRTVDEKLKAENHEIATMLIEKKLVNPSHIKPILDEIVNADKEADDTKEESIEEKTKDISEETTNE